jgi:hypothetical protein
MRPYDAEKTASRPICKVNQRTAQSVVRSGTTCEYCGAAFFRFFVVLCYFIVPLFFLDGQPERKIRIAVERIGGSKGLCVVASSVLLQSLTRLSSSSMNSVPFLSIPAELHLCIFQLLTPTAICALRGTCKFFREIIDAHGERVWRRIAIESSYLDEQTSLLLAAEYARGRLQLHPEAPRKNLLLLSMRKKAH